jgi:hypothetical protein
MSGFKDNANIQQDQSVEDSSQPPPIQGGQQADGSRHWGDGASTVSASPSLPQAPPSQPQPRQGDGGIGGGQFSPHPPRPIQDLHAGIFRNILETLSGGSPLVPQTVPDGKVTMVKQHFSRKSLGASILAGALSSMVAGMPARGLTSSGIVITDPPDT